jgi:hypothetical protein
VSIVGYSFALAQLQVAPVWTVLFFGFLSISGYQTVGPCVRVVSTFLLEKFERWEARDRITMALLVCTAFVLVNAAFFTKV